MTDHTEPATDEQRANRYRDESKAHQREREASERRLRRALAARRPGKTREQIEADARDEARRDVLPTVIAAVLTGRGVADAPALVEFLDLSTLVDAHGEPDPAQLDRLAASTKTRRR